MTISICFLAIIALLILGAAIQDWRERNDI